MEDLDLIIGLHSIVEALLNPARMHRRLIATDEGMKELQKRNVDLSGLEVQIHSPHQFQETAKQLFLDFDYTYRRIPSGLLLVTSSVELYDIAWLYAKLEKGEKLKIFCLDQVTDTHNGAAIMRTASFYGADAIIVAHRGNFGLGPNFSRIASGGVEHVKIVKCSSLPKVLKKLQDKGVCCIGFSEHAEEEAVADLDEKSICLVMGAEDTGLSNAVERILTTKVAFKPVGRIKSLNVSVAAGIAMERFFAKA